MMRLLFTVILTLLVFTANQVAVAYEQCDDPSCSLYSGEMTKKTEQGKKDSNLPVHCALGGHHIADLPQNTSAAVGTEASATTFWGTALMPESAIPEGLIEPPSLA
ncbi:MAG: hypothetical protein DI582_06830 [Azospirillum brasilense]|nr:MAG: hypothetical protein DI582_06830 [Azospirillum brasilense]